MRFEKIHPLIGLAGAMLLAATAVFAQTDGGLRGYAKDERLCSRMWNRVRIYDALRERPLAVALRTLRIKYSWSL